MEFHVEYKDGYFVGKTCGEAVAAQFGDLLDLMLHDDRWSPGMSWMHDHSELNADPLTVSDIRHIAKLCAERRTQIGSGRCAIVVRADLEYGLARMWSAYVDGSWDVATSVFRTSEQGRAWLLSDQPAPDGQPQSSANDGA